MLLEKELGHQETQKEETHWRLERAAPVCSSNHRLLRVHAQLSDCRLFPGSALGGALTSFSCRDDGPLPCHYCREGKQWVAVPPGTQGPPVRVHSPSSPHIRAEWLLSSASTLSGSGPMGKGCILKLRSAFLLCLCYLNFYIDFIHMLNNVFYMHAYILCK